jgi:glycosyltransferase involved in cell wall biosynthesis
VKLAIVASHPIQHFCPLYRAIAREPGIELRVFFASTAGVDGYFDQEFQREIKWAQNLLDGYEYEFLPKAESKTLDGPLDSSHLTDRLQAYSPNVVQVYGFYHAVSRRALVWAIRNRRRTLLMADSELRMRRKITHRLRKAITVPVALAMVDGFLTIGNCNEAYYQHYGVPSRKLFRSPYPIDDVALEIAKQNRNSLRKGVRANLGIPEDALVALVVGKLTVRKAPQDALEGLVRYDGGWKRDAHLVFAGDGPERSRLEARASEAMPGRVHFPGFVNVDQLPGYYVASDILLHPSSEDPHPLATSEGVYCGLPAVISDRVGSVGPTDDVRLGENGLEYPFGQVGSLAAALEKLTDPNVRAAYSARSIAIGQERTLQVSVAGYKRALASLG